MSLGHKELQGLNLHPVMSAFNAGEADGSTTEDVTESESLNDHSAQLSNEANNSSEKLVGETRTFVRAHVPLTEDLISQSLSMICKTADGMAHTFIKLKVNKAKLTDINLIASYIHLRNVDLSCNNLVDISPLNNLSHLIVLHVNENCISSPALQERTYLQVASFIKNKIKDTEGICHPKLEELYLSNNRITRLTGFDPTKLTRLHTIDLSNNLLETAEGLNMPNLKRLKMAYNKMTSVQGLEELSNLTFLDLSCNHIKQLDNFSSVLFKLEYINLRNNGITTFKELEKLRCLPSLKRIRLADNPISKDEDYRLEVLTAIPTIDVLDDDDFREDERQEAEALTEERMRNAIAEETRQLEQKLFWEAEENENLDEQIALET